MPSCRSKHTMYSSQHPPARSNVVSAPNATTLHPMHPLRSPSQSSSVSYTSTANLVPHDSSRRAKSSFAERLFVCGKRKRKLYDTEKNSTLGASQSGPPTKHFKLLQGWRVIFLGSCQSRFYILLFYSSDCLVGLNILILLIPAAVSIPSRLRQPSDLRFGLSGY